MTVPEASVAIELERLRGTVATGFAEVEGSLAVLVERSARTERDVAQLREDTEKDLDDLRAEVETLKKNRWPLPAVAALTGTGGLAVALWSALGR
ncbi:hypothetical protein BN159_5998 [Streptomyces davaonensis JCM 4913]|uniref:Uncharacterized protein n=1 Tax=Streptomyces davaonensis (strain DSM 101723 / JCM 4913 / KCC S-0913 / 768) TaxID=1214101 RepID=K4RAX0_STRDJ|nr:hypothetical protein [Streptomyces davaonensis]CCK30377.1 hypothetical protein BN159_5998 [Streptomyces davaonensis JCM 4913]